MATDNRGPVIIALCGDSGSGKSTFINDASNSRLPVGHSITSYTEQVQLATPFELDGREIHLIDTPGFGGTYLPDTEILERIGAFLSLSHTVNQHLSGIIYMHRITDSRFGAISRRNFRLFRELCGERTLKNVVITTNMWSDPHLKAELDREQELRENPQFFQPVLANGARMARYVRSRGESDAHDVIRMLIDNTPLPTYLGEALTDGVPLGETNPGKALNEELQELWEKQKAEIEAIKREMQEALRTRDQEAIEELEEEWRLSRQRLENINAQMRSLNNKLGEEPTERIEQTKQYEEANQQTRDETDQLNCELISARNDLKNAGDSNMINLLDRVHELESGIKRKRSEFWRGLHQQTGHKVVERYQDFEMTTWCSCSARGQHGLQFPGGPVVCNVEEVWDGDG